LLLVIKK